MKNLLFLLVVLFGFSASSCAQTATSAGVTTVSAKEFKKMAESGKYTVIDIRTPREFNAQHIEGAINIDFYKKDFMSKMAKYKNKPFIYYCRSGNRTSQAKRRFNKFGYKEGYELGHGIISWNREKFPYAK